MKKCHFFPRGNGMPPPVDDGTWAASTFSAAAGSRPTTDRSTDCAGVLHLRLDSLADEGCFAVLSATAASRSSEGTAASLEGARRARRSGDTMGVDGDELVVLSTERTEAFVRKRV